MSLVGEEMLALESENDRLREENYRLREQDTNCARELEFAIRRLECIQGCDHINAGQKKKKKSRKHFKKKKYREYRKI